LTVSVETPTLNPLQQMRHPFFVPMVGHGGLLDSGLAFYYAAIYSVEPRGRWTAVALPEVSVEYPDAGTAVVLIHTPDTSSRASEEWHWGGPGWSTRSRSTPTTVRA
jgi:hypothetical protein